LNLKVLILDQTHGGDKIAREHLKKGDDVTVVDVYGTMKANEAEALNDEGIRCMRKAPREHFDLAILPIHCPDKFLSGPSYDERITHHEAVGRLVKFDMPIVEVTGVGGKTSTCFVLAHILSSKGNKVLLHSSRGDFSYGKDVKLLSEKASIAPASLIDLSNLAGYDFGVMEESLGGCGIGKVCCVTTIGDNYQIAGKTRRAFDGKVQMVSMANGSIMFPEIEKGLWSPHVKKGTKVFTFGEGSGVQVSFENHCRLGDPVVMDAHIDGKTYEVILSDKYLAPAYQTAFEAAITIARALGIEDESIAASLESFEGVPGRGDVEWRKGVFFLNDRNPGVGARSVDWNLSILEERYDAKDVGLVIDPMDSRICEKLDVNAILDVVSTHPAVKRVYLFERNPADSKLWPNLIHINDQASVLDGHEIVLWCTKEGFQ